MTSHKNIMLDWFKDTLGKKKLRDDIQTIESKLPLILKELEEWKVNPDEIRIAYRELVQAIEHLKGGGSEKRLAEHKIRSSLGHFRSIYLRNSGRKYDLVLEAAEEIKKKIADIERRWRNFDSKK